MEDRYSQGFNKMESQLGESGKSILASFPEKFEDIGKYILEFVFADLGGRNILEDKYREMITIVSLISQGDTANQLKLHISCALDAGLTENEVAETIIQCVPHVGFPKVLNAISIASFVFEQRNEDENE
ncbi:carboxymuconolactone decarboxylase family protein [Candidatus Enterococcus mansonii]|uniref:Carboxymuconolactone decarboxylase-like domain-containing protein n=1 Tax=Candidatus Enterococcus mansonii TaxID=1834181 RepID=A0A242CK28_9ENTE|nr:carboxymuconolactone decarboxylase family protein [Enterococcus sp. 4G2_DIV0659]OTO10607.1 hypothetical protein A5880_001291 [Enterococcus sp. 4G2_DIV0659]